MDGRRLQIGFVALMILATVGCGDEVSARCTPEQALGGGVYECADGTVHRVSDTACSAPAECAQDEDCSPDELCECRPEEEGGSACVRAGCQTDSDCADLLCARSRDACGTAGFFCETAEDECSAAEFGCVFWDATARWEIRGAIGCP